MPGKETRLFSRIKPPPVTEKPGFLRSSQKKMYKKLLIGYLVYTFSGLQNCFTVKCKLSNKRCLFKEFFR
ncbi:Uncharacterized protein dnm_062660 [Desulfonema magnum]|uniref:Uncharacterized protein n=1 Tax=Desulfonema magnum TaxID=45655 RepID=A0A975BSE2_9BACT|nr:Uncharacterized protein dnm_062660 [Desulfonema magnum]